MIRGALSVGFETVRHLRPLVALLFRVRKAARTGRPRPVGSKAGGGRVIEDEMDQILQPKRRNASFCQAAAVNIPLLPQNKSAKESHATAAAQGQHPFGLGVHSRVATGQEASSRVVGRRRVPRPKVVCSTAGPRKGVTQEP